MKRLLCALLLPVAVPLASAQAPFAYQQPPDVVRAVLDAKTLPNRIVDPTGRTLAIIEARRYPTIEELSRPFLRLAGLRIDPAANGPHRVAHINRLSFRIIGDEPDAERVVPLPSGGDFYRLQFSPDGKRFVLYRRAPAATELWLGDTGRATVRQVADVFLQNAADDNVTWLGSDEIVALTVNRKRSSAPVALAPAGPVVQESFGKRSPERTYQDLLRTPHDEALFEHYFTSELTRIDLATGRQTPIGAPGLYGDVSSVGDGKHLLVERHVRPFSFVMPYGGFPKMVDVVDLQGRSVRSLAKMPLRENIPVQGVQKGPRGFGTSATDGAVFWVEALDEGDPRNKVPHRDKLMRLAAPYNGDPVEVARFAHRLASVQAMDDGRALATDYDRDRAWRRTYVVDPAKPGTEPVLLFDLSIRDRYNDPGRPVFRVLPSGRAAIQVNDGHVFYIGAGASAAGDRPFLDRWNLAERTKRRVFQSAPTHYEQVMRVLDVSGSRFLTLRENANEPPNVYVHGIAPQPLALTQVADPAPQIRAIKRELVRFKRKDGVDQSFWLYRPTDQKPGERRPAFLWAYPLEYTDPALAGQVTGAANRFEVFAGASPLFLVLEGFVVLQDATMPVVGDPEKVNDTFVEQITMNAEAAIAKAAEMGVVDPARVAVGGHSYGAYMTVNLLAHTDLFKAGIARSGAYNRTLTPFGFQSERRTLWEAPQAYVKLSPFLVADKLKEPLLMIHGEVDDNSGTFPEQSDRMFAALAGTGGHVRYVKLPAEAHGYSARESVGHTLWEMSAWLKKHLGDPRAP